MRLAIVAFCCLLVFINLSCTNRSSTYDLKGSTEAFRKALLQEELARRGSDSTVVPALSLAHYNFIRGELALYDGKHNDALNYFSRASVIDERQSPMLRRRVAQLLVRNGKLKEALIELDKSHEASSKDIQYYNLRAGILSALKRNDEAIDDYKKIIELDTEGNEDPYILLASLLVKSKRSP